MAVEDLIGRVERLTVELERVQDRHARSVAEQLMATVLELHGEGLERMLEAVDEDTRKRMAEDAVVASLLLIHDLYPVPIEERVQQALDEVRPYMESHGGNVELLGIEDGVARLRLKGSCDGCAASASTLELAVEKALEESAPDLLGMEVEGAVAAGPPITGMELPMAVVQANGESGGDAPRSLSDWVSLDGVEELAAGQLRETEVAGKRLVIANVDGSLLAYRDACVSCGSAFEGAELSDGVLPCPSCGRRYFLPRAGRSLDDERLQLEPVPLLAENGAGAKVALPA
jgi:Fe-S cluster biogenesis protein NfuA/nitrite reductase/ring-hydroxylating ferredoxin subunit